ncbi:hypothetical protein EJ06DRAFT_30834 [Trichodelitschia bisporula]|uniref:Uncharacterized protein n=1 Tax=Trichodelitschia bisporula TaxID=703511 RepID=A0A6G1IBA3_9PEZI|nr:hypothetical protein EJ06DRAFT_30834 [Trichodelitschia bisporula]
MEGGGEGNAQFKRAQIRPRQPRLPREDHVVQLVREHDAGDWFLQLPAPPSASPPRQPGEPKPTHPKNTQTSLLCTAPNAANPVPQRRHAIPSPHSTSRASAHRTHSAYGSITTVLSAEVMSSATRGGVSLALRSKSSVTMHIASTADEMRSSKSRSARIHFGMGVGTRRRCRRGGKRRVAQGEFGGGGAWCIMLSSVLAVL